MNKTLTLPWANSWPQVREKISAPISTIEELENCLRYFYERRIKPHQVVDLFNEYFASEKNYSSEQFFKLILPQMRAAILDGPALFKNKQVRMLEGNSNITLTARQVLTLLSAAFFNLFPRASFLSVFTNKNIFALQCLLAYFAQAPNNRILIYSSKVQGAPPLWKLSSKNVRGATSAPAPPPIELVYTDTRGAIAYSASVTPETYALSVRPELFVAALITSAPVTAVCVYGAQQFSDCEGNGSAAIWIGTHTSSEVICAHSQERIVRHATIFMLSSSLDDLRCGLSAPLFPPAQILSTETYFDQTYFVQQVLAASECGHTLVCPHNDEIIDKWLDWAQKFTVGQLYDFYLKYQGEKNMLQAMMDAV